jgi:large subunit ribosomal protein L21
MFAIVRTGGKQYRVAPGDKIVVEKLAGNAGDSVDLTDVLLAGEGSDLKSTAGLIVAAEIVAQAKADKVTVFKKRRRHNYRRKAGHRQQHTILKIVSIGGKKAEKKAEAKAEPKQEKPAAPAKAKAAPKAETKAAAPKAEKKAAPAEAETSTKDAAPAKAAAKKAAPAAKKTEK